MTFDILAMANAVRSAVSAVPLSMRGRTVAMGADGTPTSYIDRVAEDAIIGFMDHNNVQANLLSEEAGFVDRGFDITLVADPVDGTHNASSGIPFYSVSLALGRRTLDGITAGLVMNLVTGDVFLAEKGKGATLNGVSIHSREPDDDKLLMAYLGASASERTRRVAAGFRRVRSLGCVSLELCAVACGQADAFFIDYPETVKCPRVVDIAAAVLILREAGGQVRNANKEILEMPLSLDARSCLLATGSDAVLELIE